MHLACPGMDVQGVTIPGIPGIIIGFNRDVAWGVTAVGGTHVCLRRVDPGEIWRLILEEGVTHLNGAPTVLIGLVNHPAAKTAQRVRRLPTSTS